MEWKRMGQGWLTCGMWNDSLGTRHSLLSKFFHFNGPASLYCEEYAHISLLRGCIWITVATEQQCELNILIQIGSGAKCWMDICHWAAGLMVIGRIRDSGQNVLQYFETGSSNTLSYFQIFFLIAFIEEAFIRNMIFIPCIKYTITIYYALIVMQ